MSRQATDAAETRADGAAGMFEVDFSSTLYDGINYVRGPGSTHKLSTPPPMAKHGMIFEGSVDPGVPGYVRVIRESSGLYGGLYVPTLYEGRQCVRRVADTTPLRPSRPRKPPMRPPPTECGRRRPRSRRPSRPPLSAPVQPRPPWPP